jgi:repressor LexA
MTKLSKRISKSRARLGWSQAELARQVTEYRRPLGRTEVKQQSINQLELGEVSTPRYLFDLAQVLGIDFKWMVGEGGFGQIRDKVVQAPLISWEQASALTEAEMPYEPSDAQGWIPVSHIHENLIALQVLGDSMNKIACDGSTIIVDLSDRDPIDGKHFVFHHDGEATFRTYRGGPPIRLECQSFGSTCQPIETKGGVEIVGRVIRKTEYI